MVTVSMLGLNLHSVILRGEVTVTKNNVTSVKRCQKLTQDYQDFLIYDWTWIKLHVYSAVPFGIILVSNICIILKVIASKKAAHKRVFPANANNTEEKASSGTTPMTILLLALNVVFLVCTTPNMAFYVAVSILQPYTSTALEANMILFQAISNMLMYTNHAVNFLLYVLSGSGFRQQTLDLFCKHRHIESVEDHAADTQRFKVTRAEPGCSGHTPPNYNATTQKIAVSTSAGRESERKTTMAPTTVDNF
jgi:hypothetical protein